MPRISIVALAAVVAVASAAASPSRPSLSTAPQTQHAGLAVELRGSGWRRSGECPASVGLSARPSAGGTIAVGRAPVRGDGRFERSWRLPARLSPGRLVVRASQRCVAAATGAHLFAADAVVQVTAATWLTVTPSRVRAGRAVRLRGAAAGCPAGDTVTLISRAFSPRHAFAGVPAVLARVRSGGSFDTTTVIPASRRPGRYGITARCGGGNLGVDVPLAIVR